MSSSKEIFFALLKSSLGIFSKIVFNAGVIKIIAVIMGPYGLGLFAQIRQIWQTSVIIGSLNSGAAVIQGISSRQGLDKKKYTSVIFWLILIFNIVVSLIVLFFSSEISFYFLKSTEPESIMVVRLISIASFIGVFLIFFSSILNGFYAIGRYSIVTAFGSFTLILIAWPFVSNAENFGVEFVYMLIISEGFALALCIFFLVKGNLFTLSWPVNIIEFSYLKDFFKTSFILLITGVFTMLVMLFIRILIIEKYDFYGVGIFDAAWLLCMVYVLVITKSFGTYFLPKLSGLNDLSQRNNLLNEGLRIVLIISVPLIVIMISFKPLIINLLYSNEFSESINIMKWMLIGDFFKIVSWFLAYTILAYKDMKVFLWSEIFFFTALLLGVFITINFFGSYEGLGIVFLIVSIPYFIFTIRYNQLKHEFRLNKFLTIALISAFIVIIFSSILTWDIHTLNYQIASINIFIGIIFSCLLLNENERKKILNFINKNNF